MSPPTVAEIDTRIGILCFSTRFPGCGGKIRNTVNDFCVNEILSPKSVSGIQELNTGDSVGYPVYSMRKIGIDTNHALSNIFKKTGTRLRSLGLKDSNAITTQYVYSTSKSKGIKKFESDKYILTRLGYTKKPLSKKHMIGNRFSITVSNSNNSDFQSFDEYQNILNFYGYQRFGSKRPVTHLIGKALVQKQYSDAIDYMLSFTSKYDSRENTKIRKELADASNYKQIYDSIPPQMDLEKIIISELIKHGDQLRAIRALPVQMRRFYVQAYQSFLFNLTISKAFDYGEELFRSQDGDICYDNDAVLGKYVSGLDQSLAIPIVGYSYYKKTRFDFYISKILDDEEVTPKDFYIKEIQEASNEGGFRNSAIRITDFKIVDNTVSFTLSRGSFATIVMREIMKPSEPLSCGF